MKVYMTSWSRTAKNDLYIFFLLCETKRKSILMRIVQQFISHENILDHQILVSFVIICTSTEMMTNLINCGYSFKKMLFLLSNFKVMQKYDLDDARDRQISKFYSNDD